LKIDQREAVTTIRWNHLGVAEVIGWVAVPMMAVWGIASARGLEMVFGMRVLPMSALATSIYWSGLAVVALHLTFNRRVQLTSSQDEITYAFRLFPAVRRTWPREQLASVLVQTREDSIAETGAAGQSIENTRLIIRLHDTRDLVIRGLSDEDAKLVREYLVQHR